MQDRRHEDTFTYAPLRDAHGLPALDEHLTGTATRKTDDSVSHFAFEPSFVHLNVVHRGAKRLRPPLADANRTHVHVVTPTRIVTRDPPIDPEVVGSHEHEPPSTATATKWDLTKPAVVEHVGPLASPQHEGCAPCAHHKHGGYVEATD